MRRSMRTRFAVLLSAVMGALLLIVAGTLVVIRAVDARRMVETHAKGFAETTNTRLCDVWRLYYNSGSYKFREIVRKMMEKNEDLHRIFILSVTGEVLYDSQESADLTLMPDRPRRRLEDPELAAAAARPESWSKTIEDPALGEVLLIGSPYFEEWGRHPYSVLYVFTYANMKQRVLTTSILPTLLAVLLALGVSAAFSFWLAGRVTRPVRTLTEGVRLFSAGRDHQLIDIQTGDELEELGESFNRMAERIRQQVEKLENANRELSTLDRMKTDLLANVSHELRTPLAAIRGYVEFIQEGQLGPITEAQRKGLDVCLRNAERLTKTINMLLDFSRMELGRVTIRPSPFQLGRLIAQVSSGMEAEAKKRKVKLTVRVPRDLKPVDADRDRVTQVLENLVTNALKFTPEGGDVQVAAQMVGGDGAAPSRVEVTVADSGAGIAPEEKARIFDKFYQSDATATRKFGGIGLGLAIVKSILEAHQSEITVEDRPGGGSIFKFSLAAVETRTESGIFEGLLPMEGGSAEILAIDDDPDFLAIIRETLTKQGYSVRTARTAAEGLAAAREKPPRLVLLDIKLPDRDGLDVLQALKESPETKDVPTLVVSVVDERLEGLRLGAVEYLVKPVDRGRLVEAASRVLGRSPSSSGRFEPSPRVLVVDDEEEVAQLLARSLRVNGFKVETAGTARDALEKLQESPPDLVLLDLFLPDASGWDVLMRIKATPEGSSLPVIILTAHAEPEQMREGERLGVNAFLAKPIDMNSILERIRTLLRESGAA